MVGPATSDFNVILPGLTSAPGDLGAAFASQAGEAMSADRFRRELTELQNICDGLPEPQKSALASTLSSLQSQFNPRLGISPGLAIALQEARVQAQNSLQEARNAASSDFAGALATLDGYRLSASGQLRVERVFSVLQSGTNEDIAVAMLGESAKDPVALKGAQEWSSSTAGEKTLFELRRMANGSEEDRHALRQALTNSEKRNEIFREASRDRDYTPQQRRLLKALSDGDIAYDIESQALAEKILRGNVPAEALQQEGQHLLDRRFDRLAEVMTTGDPHYSQLPGATQLIIDALPAEERAAAQTNPDALSAAMQRIYTTTDAEAVKRDHARANGDLSKMEPGNRAYLMVERALATTRAQTRGEGNLDEGQRYRALMGRDRSTMNMSEQRDYDALQVMLNPKASIEERARGSYMTAGRMSKAGLDSKDHAMGMAALVFAYANTRNPDPKIALGEYTRLSAGTTPEALAYQRSFQEFVDREIGAIPNDMGGIGQYTAIEALGRQISERQVEITQDPVTGHLSFYNNTNFNVNDTFLGESGLAGVMNDYPSMMRSIYQESRIGDRSDDKNFVAVVRALDTYRLQSDPQWQPIIRDLYVGNPVNLSEVGARLEKHIAQKNIDYAGFSSDIVQNAEPLQRAVLEERGLIKNGALDVEGLMKTVEANKLFTTTLYQKYLSTPTSELRSPVTVLQEEKRDENGVVVRRQVTSLEFANARVLSEVASQLRAADAIEQMGDPKGERAVAISKKISDLKEAGQPVPEALAREQALVDVLTNYSPETATSVERAAFIDAVRNYMMYDPYVAEKERADTYLAKDEDKANIVKATVRLVESRITVNGGNHAARDHASVAPEVLQAPQSFGPAGNENEGAGLLDRMKMDPFERQIFDAVKDLSAESRRTLLGSSALLNEVNEGAGAEQAFYSYNEIETALKLAGITSAAQLTDANGNGFDAEDIRAALVPNATATVNGQGSGRT